MSAAQRAAKWVGPTGMGLSAGIGGMVAGLKENVRLKEERAQHMREMAKGKTFEVGSKRREEMEKFRYKEKSANELADNLKKSFEALEQNPSPEQLEFLLQSVAEIDSRIAFSDRNKIDLISYSDSKKVEQERTDLFVSTAQVKVFLKQNIGKDWASKYKNEDELKNYLIELREAKIQNDFTNEKNIKDEAFLKMKKNKVIMSAVIGFGVGIGIGVATQEAQAYFGGANEGIFGVKKPNGEAVKHFTALESLRRYIFGDTKGVAHHIEGTKSNLPIETKNYIEEHRDLFSKIKRGVWADNDTVKFDKNELKLGWGGMNGAGVDKQGNFVFDIRHMMADGSFHEGQHWDPQALMKEGKLKLLISLSKNTQNQVAEIPIINGKAVINPNSEIGKIAFENINGRAKFLGKFAEVAVVNQNSNGEKVAQILATESGTGVKNIIEKSGVELQSDYDTAFPLFNPPILARRPLESLKSSGNDIETPKEGEITPIQPNPTVSDKETDSIRAAASHTIYKAEKYDDLNAPTLAEGEQKFLDLTRKLWTELTVHGKDENGNVTNRADLDAYACLKLVEIAGIKVDMDKVNFVKAGDKAESGVIMDTSNNDGIIAEEEGKRLIFDHHGLESDRNTSATKYVYETLTELGLIKKEAYLDKFVDFVTKCDNADFSLDKMNEIYDNYSKNLYGLAFRMKVDDILNLFKDGVDPEKELPKDYLAEHTYFNPKDKKEESLTQLSEFMTGQMARGRESLKKVEQAGFFVDTGAENFGKILIDTGKNIGKGRNYPRIEKENVSSQLEIFLKGYGGYLVWSPINNSFVLYTQKKMERNMFSQGFNMRGHMWLKPQNSQEKLTITLEEIFSKLSGKDFKIEGNLKSLLDVDKKSKEMLDLLNDGKLTREDLINSAKEIDVPLGKILTDMLMQRNAINGKFLKKVEKIPDTPEKAGRIGELAVKTILDSQKTAEVGKEKPKTQEIPPASIKKLSNLFSTFDLSYDAIKTEAKKINMEPVQLAVRFIQSNIELKKKYDVKFNALPMDKRDDKSIEKLALTVILEEEKKNIKEEIKKQDEKMDRKNKEIVESINNAEKQRLELEKMDGENNRKKLEEKKVKVLVDIMNYL